MAVMHDGRRRGLKLAACAILSLALLFLPKVLVQLYASEQRTRLTGQIWAAPSEQEAVERFARWAAGYWRVGGERDFWNRLRGLPKPFKPAKEPIAFLSGGGQCTEFVAAARWVLGDRLRVERHDLLFPTDAHSAISVRLSDGRWVFIDPYLGWIFKDKSRLLGLGELRDRLTAGHSLADYAVPLKADARAEFYPSLPETFDAKAFETLPARLLLPVKGRRRWSLGEIDGDWRDVKKAGEGYRLTSHFFYVGRRYPAKFQFHYLLPDDGRAYRFAFHLTAAPSRADLPPFSIAPSIEDKTLRFRLAPARRALIMDTARADTGQWYGIDRFEVIAEEPYPPGGG